MLEGCMRRLTAITTALNEEAHIARALGSIRSLADEIVVVDGGSTDHTPTIAREFTEKVFVRPWPGYGPQKNFALQQASGDWVLFVDADEEVTPELAEEIRGVLRSSIQHPESRISVYFVRIITFFLGRPLKHLWGTNPRLLRRSAVRWDDRPVHEQVVRSDGSIVRLEDPDTLLLTHPLLHPSHYTTLAAYRERRDRYTTRDAEEMLATGQDRIGKPVGSPERSAFHRVRFLSERAAKKFLRLFVGKRGALDGWRGWLWCWLSAEYEVIMCKKYLALRRARGRGVA